MRQLKVTTFLLILRVVICTLGRLVKDVLEGGG